MSSTTAFVLGVLVGALLILVVAHFADRNFYR